MHRGIAPIIVLIAAIACVGTEAEESEREARPASDVAPARAVMVDARGARLGEVRLEQTPHGVLLHGELRGLPPGAHGFHIHETGRCEPTFEAAGGHYDPDRREHGFRNPAGPHAGDLPNIFVARDSAVAFDVVTERVTLEGGRAPLFDRDGSALIVHAGADDYRTNPSGDSGDPIACGVVVR